MSDQYCRLVGVLGAPEAGKTAALVSLYLLLAKGNLASFTFADSRTIMAFEEISRGARQWNEGAPPEEMTVHTELGDSRAAGFLHLRLLDGKTGTTVNFLIPDLPGEWTNALIESNRVDRLAFLKSADCIWVMVDGEQLSSADRQYALHRTKLLLQRIASFLSPKLPPIVLVVTRKDVGRPTTQTIDDLKAEAGRYGLSLSVVEIASFSDDDKIPPGDGIASLLDWCMRLEYPAVALPPDLPTEQQAREILNFRVRT